MAPDRSTLSPCKGKCPLAVFCCYSLCDLGYFFGPMVSCLYNEKQCGSTINKNVSLTRYIKTKVILKCNFNILVSYRLYKFTPFGVTGFVGD